MLTLRATADRLDFLEGSMQVIARKPAQLVQAHMLVVVHLKQMGGKVLSAAALASLEDHGPRS